MCFGGNARVQREAADLAGIALQRTIVAGQRLQCLGLVIDAAYIQDHQPLRFELPGGPLEITVGEDSARVRMRGPARLVFELTPRAHFTETHAT